MTNAEEVAYLIPLTQGRHAIVDKEDWERLRRHSWHISNGYASRTVIACGKQRGLSMHRELLGLSHGDARQGDHRNRNRLDNRRANLRIVTIRGNAENRERQSSCGSGVYFDPLCHSKPYQARAWVAGKNRHIGMFATAEEAEQARRKFLEGLGE